MGSSAIKQGVGWISDLRLGEAQLWLTIPPNLDLLDLEFEL